MDSFLPYCQAKDSKISLKMALKHLNDTDMPDFKHAIVDVRLPVNLRGLAEKLIHGQKGTE